MTKKLPPQWEDIKLRRTVLGESWQMIREVYDVALSTLKNRASRENWKVEAQKIDAEIRRDVIETRKRALNKVALVFEQMVDNLLEELPKRKSTIPRGSDFPDRYHLEAWKMGLAAYLKSDNNQLNEEQEPPGFIVKRDA